MNRYKKSKINGIEYERLGIEYLKQVFKDVEFVDKEFDVLINNKICVEIKGTYYTKYGKRSLSDCCYLLRDYQHKKIIEVGGYYLFILKNGDIKFKIIKADEIDLSNKSYFYVNEIFKELIK